MTQEQLNKIIEDPKAFLNRGFKANERIAAKRERIETWRQRAESITAELKTDGGTGGGGPSKLVETAVCNIVDLEKEIEEEIQALVEVEHEIGEAINELVFNPTYKALLEMRYLNHYKLEEIAVRLNYAFRWVQRLNSRAVAALKEAAESRAQHAI